MEKLKCPNCEGNYMSPKNNGQRFGSILGGILGVATRLGASIGGPAGALASALAGSLAGQKLGQVIDDHVIRSYRCTKCGKEISL